MLKVSLQNTLGDALRQVRKSRRLTQGAVAKLGGVSVPTILLLERGQGNLRTWTAVLDMLGLERGPILPHKAACGRSIRTQGIVQGIRHGGRRICCCRGCTGCSAALIWIRVHPWQIGDARRSSEHIFSAGSAAV